MNESEDLSLSSTTLLVNFILDLKCSEIPNDVSDRAKITLLDVITYGLSGYKSDGSRFSRISLNRFNLSNYGCSVWDTSEKLPYPWAALSNAIAFRSSKIDYTHLPN